MSRLLGAMRPLVGQSISGLGLAHQNVGLAGGEVAARGQFAKVYRLAPPGCGRGEAGAGCLAHDGFGATWCCAPLAGFAARKAV